jgi:hypothetical protein
VLKEGEREKERERGRNRIILNIDVRGIPMQLQRGAGGSALILAVRISSGVEKKIQMGGVQMMVQQIHQDWFFQE